MKGELLESSVIIRDRPQIDRLVQRGFGTLKEDILEITFMESLFLPIAGGLGVLAAIFAYLFFKGRGQLSYLLLVIEDQIKDLEGLKAINLAS